MPFPQFDIRKASDGHFVLARTPRDEVSEDHEEMDIIGVFDTEEDARIQLLRVLATPPGEPLVHDTQGFTRWNLAS